MTEQQALIPLGTGECLRQARERSKQSVEDVARALKVPVDVVTAIESEQLERYARIYRKGYVKAYASYLGIGAAETAAMVEAIDTLEPELRPAFSMNAVPARASERWLRAGSYALGSLLIGTLAWQLTHEAVRLSQGGAQEFAPVRQPDELMAAPQTGNAAVSDSHVNASIASLEDMGRRRGAAAGQPAWDALAGRPAAGEGVADQRVLHHLRVDASGDSWVEIVDAGGTQLELDLVRGGSSRVYEGEAPFRILFGRASAVDLYLDGQLVDTSEHTSGNVTQMSLEADES